MPGVSRASPALRSIPARRPPLAVQNAHLTGVVARARDGVGRDGLLEPHQILGVSAPSNLRIAADRPEARAGRVEEHGVEGLGRVVAVDGTLFDCLPKMSWASYRSTKNKLKGHFFFNLDGLPERLVLTAGTGSERDVCARAAAINR